jgi:uncharacterized radical SAM superfamily Fe-S cluster-containing enzyme
MSQQLLAETESVCPVCLQTLAAQRVVEDDNIYLTKYCPQHGHFKTILWRGVDSYRQWGKRGSHAARPPVCETVVERGCPHDCGLCPDHLQHTCCVLLEVTQRCNIKCPICFASATEGSTDPTLAEIGSWLRLLLAHGSKVNLQLSGGEPTQRDDLPEIVALARSLGFDFVQLNTNGIRLAREGGYAQRLADAGLDCVFLQFDGVGNEAYQRIRGARLLDLKIAALDRCAEAGLGVVLVPTLVPGVNVGEIGEIIDFALARIPAVRAVHFQPISYFGRYPAPPADADRLTLPEIMDEIEVQTKGRVHTADFSPGSAENAYCSFSGKFFVGRDGVLRPSAGPAANACCGADDTSSACGCGVPSRGDDALRARQFVASHWVTPEQRETTGEQNPGINVTSFDDFLAAHQHSFCISAMAFQDAWNLDLERLRECFIHVVAPDRRIVPFCAYNLTSISGASLYRHPACAEA